MAYDTGIMIACLEGTMEFKGDKFLILKTGGIGYKIFAGPETIRGIPGKGEPVKLWTHQHVREDALELYGFLHFAELELFELLISISGIGPKSGLGVLGIAPVDTLKKAIASSDTSYLTRVSGIGRKTAEKIVLELREKMSGRGITVEAPELKDEADALDALVSLGYTQRDAREALQKIPEQVTGIENRVRAVLKTINKKK